MHVKITNGTPETYSIGQLRRDNPQVSFPKTIPDSLLADYGVYALTPTPRPPSDHTKTVTEGTPALIHGVWTQVWTVSDATAEEIAERTAERARSVRSERDAALQETDWVVIKSMERGETVPASWASYRQALRDITASSGFPFGVIWPEKPA